MVKCFFQDLFTDNTKMPKEIGCRFLHYWQMITVKKTNFVYTMYIFHIMYTEVCIEAHRCAQVYIDVNKNTDAFACMYTQTQTHEPTTFGLKSGKFYLEI